VANHTVFPLHGRLSCSNCFKSQTAYVQDLGKWRMRKDPGAWGSSTPKYVVMGFSKGATQADIYATGNFNDVAFGGEITRRNLTNILKTIGLLQSTEQIDQKIKATERDFHFGSLVRCSLSRYDDKESAKRGVPVYASSGPLVTKSFVEIPEIVDRCAKTFLATIPESVKVMIVLGVTDAYVRSFRKKMQALHPEGFRVINKMAYQNNNVLWVHVTHPSRGNGTLNAWLTRGDDDTSGSKRLLAIDALRSFGIGT